jgi:hypothetical protein
MARWLKSWSRTDSSSRIWNQLDFNLTRMTDESLTERLTGQRIPSNDSHTDPKVNDHFLSWLNHNYGEHGQVRATRGKPHDYLGTTFDCSDDSVKIDRYAGLFRLQGGDRI